jgi:exodeoxyribonuclease-3
LATVNISGPSTGRAERLIDFLADLDADALVLTETRANKGTERLLQRLADFRYRVNAQQMPHQGERGVAVAYRPPCTGAAVSASVDLAHRFVITRLNLPRPVTLVGAYVPSRDVSDQVASENFLYNLQEGTAICP